MCESFWEPRGLEQRLHRPAGSQRCGGERGGGLMARRGVLEEFILQTRFGDHPSRHLVDGVPLQTPAAGRPEGTGGGG